MSKENSDRTEKEIMRREIGFRIMSLRIDNCYSRKKFSKLAGISSCFLYEIELGKKGFSAYTLLRIAAALKVSTDYILTGRNTTKLEEESEVALDKVNNY